MNIRSTIVVLTLSLAVAATACGDVGEPEPTAPAATATSIVEQPAGATTTPAPPDTTTIPEPAVTTTVAPATTVPAPTTTATTTAPATTITTAPPATTTTTTVPDGLPGEPYDAYGYGFGAGQEIGVFGVRYDDVLNVRARPGAGERIVATLDPLARGFSATGEGRLLPGNNPWWEVEVGGVTGWVHGRYVTRLAAPQAWDWIDFEITAPTLEELGRRFAELLLDPEQDEGEPRIVLTMAPRGEHDLGEVVYDVIGYLDDSVQGDRIRVFGRPTDDRQGFVLVGVEGTSMCWRGVSGDLCV